MTALGAKKHNATGRSTGKRKGNSRTAIGGQFAPRLIEMLRSPAFRALNLSEHRVLARLEIELADHGGADNGALACTFDDFDRYGVRRKSVAPSLRALEALGFIEITERGRAGNAEWRRPHVYRLTYRAMAASEPSHDWRHIETDAEAEATAVRARCAPEKTESQGRKRPQELGAKRHRSQRVLGGENAPTGHSGETPLLSRSREEPPNIASRRSERAPASEVSAAGGRTDDAELKAKLG